MSDSPRVTRLVMFKHGVAYVERGGPAEGPFELAFKRDEMNDILKSLAVWVAKGEARVGALSFDAPEDPEAALAARRLLFETGAALEGLIRALRGRRVVASDGARRLEGEVIGFQYTEGGHQPTQRTLVLRTQDGTLATIELSALRELELVEASSRGDLAYLIDRSRAATAEDRRVVRVDLAGRADDLRVSYVIPAPVWRVSYRLVRDGERTVLMAWGIVHNPADEELTDIDLTLTTGQPVSFVMDLYNPKRVERTVVEEASRVAPPPPRFERARMAPQATMMMATSPAGAPGSYGSAPGDEDTFDNAPTVAGRMVEAFGGAPQGGAAGGDRAEFFEYRVMGKVSLKRGGSAMVPIVSAGVDGRKERIWREGHGPSPDLVLTFKNETGAVLEEGPAVLYDEGIYSGEALVPFSARGAEVKLAYAKDLAVRCLRASTNNVVIAGVRLGDRVLVEEQYRESRHELSAESDHADAVDVIFEIPKIHGRALDAGHAQAFEETASFRRFRATVPPHGQARVVVVERWSDARHLAYDHVSAKDLNRWIKGGFLETPIHEALSGVLEGWAKARALEVQCGRVEKGRDEAYAKQQKIGEQLAVLKENGPEGSLRLRYVKELEREQDKVNICEAEIQRLRDEAEKTRARAFADLAELSQKASPPAS